MSDQNPIASNTRNAFAFHFPKTPCSNICNKTRQNQPNSVSTQEQPKLYSVEIRETKHKTPGQYARYRRSGFDSTSTLCWTKTINKEWSLMHPMCLTKSQNKHAQKQKQKHRIFHRGMHYMKSWKEWHDSSTKSNNNSGIGVAIFRVSHDQGEDEQTLRFGGYQGMTEGNS